MAEIKASANFSSVVKEINDVTQAYKEYNTKAGKVVTANIHLVNSFKSLNTVLNQTANLIGNVGKPLRDYTKNFNLNTSELVLNDKALSKVSQANSNFAISVSKTSKDLKGISDKLKVTKEDYRQTNNVVVKSRDALTAWGRQMIQNVGVIGQNGKVVTTLNKNFRNTTKGVLALAEGLKKIKAVGYTGRSHLLASKRLRLMREESLKLNSVLNKGSGPMKQISALAGKASRAINSSSKAVQGLTLSLQTFVRLGAYQIISRGLSTLTQGLRQGSEEAIDFEKKISAIRTISTDNQLAFGEWADGIREVSDEFNIPLLEATSSVYTSISNQVVKGAEAFDFLRANANLAITAQGSISDAISATSSILKSYNLDVSATNEISAKLFKTAELGRVPLASIGETIGTVTVIASRAGVSFDEVSASLATMTVQGIKPVKAITFLRNIILKILKPTEAMKDAVEQMGFASAETAVRTLGLGRFLDELRQTTTGTASELAQLLGSVRAMQAGFAISGPALSQYEENLVKIGNATKDFDERIKIAKESVGFNFQKELNQASSAMTNLGRQINETALTVIKGFGGLKNIIEQVITLIKSGLVLGAFLLARKVLVGLTADLNLASASMAKLGVTAIGTTGKITKVSLAMVKLGSALKTAFRAFAPFLAIEATFLAIDFAIANVNDRLKEQVDNERRAEKVLSNSVKNRLKAIQRFADNAKSLRDRGVVDAQVANNKRLKSLKDTLKEATKSFKKFSTESIKDSKLALSTIVEQEKALNKTLKTTEGILKQIKKGREALDDSIFGKGFSALNNLPDLEDNLNDALISGSAEKIKKSFEALKGSIESAIAGSDDQSFITAMQNRLRTLFDTVEKRTQEINKEAVRNQERIVAKRERLEEDLRKRTRAQDLIDRTSPTAILKEGTSQGVKIVGDATLKNLIKALDVAPEIDKPEIQKSINDFQELYTRRLIQLSDSELEKQKSDIIKKIKTLTTDITKTAEQEIKTVTLSKNIQSELLGFLSAGGVPEAGFDRDHLSDTEFGGKFLDEAINEDDLNFIISFRKKLKSETNILDEDLKEFRRVVSGFNLKKSGLLSVVGEEATKIDAKKLVQAQKNLQALLSASGGGGLLVKQGQAFNVVDQLDELLVVQKKLTGDSTKLNNTLKTRLKRSQELLEISKKEIKLFEQKNFLQKTTVQRTKRETELRIEKLKEDAKKNPNLKTKQKKVIKETTANGTVEGLESITTALVDLWTKVFSKSFVNASKNTPLGSGEGTGGTSTGGTTNTSGVGLKVNEFKLVGAKIGSISGLAREDGATSESEFKKITARDNLLKLDSEIATTELEIALAKDANNFEELTRLNEILKRQKAVRREAKLRDPNTVLGKINNAEKDNREFAQKAEGTASAIGSVGNVILGTSKKLDLTGLKALKLGEGFNKATGAVQFFANQLLSGRKKGLTGKQRAGSILQGAVGGATTGASVGGFWGAVIGAVAGAGISAFQTRQNGGLIYRAGGGGVPAPAKGTDTVPAMLTAGEFVVNRHSTDKFYSQLKAMNSTAYRADGGRVSNSSVVVGDINVSPSANSSAGGVDTRQIGNQIRRDIRAGRLGSMS